MNDAQGFRATSCCSSTISTRGTGERLVDETLAAIDAFRPWCFGISGRQLHFGLVGSSPAISRGVFLKMFVSLDRSIRAASRWLYRVASIRAIDHLRRRQYAVAPWPSSSDDAPAARSRGDLAR
jgi:DNA-directed RNA polymerase specialized sigma24 family protein